MTTPPHTSMTHPNRPTKACANPTKHPHPLSRPVNFSFQGFFFCSWYSGNNDARHIHDRPERAIQHLRHLTTTPYPPAVDVKAQKCASTSRQHRLLALSASDDVAGTWEDIFVSSTSVPVPYNTPRRCHVGPVTSNGPEGKDSAGGQKPPVCFLSFKAP